MRRAVVSRRAASKAIASSALRAAKITVAVAVVPGLLLAWSAGPALAGSVTARPAAAARHVPERFHLTTADSRSRRQHVHATGALTARGHALAGNFAARHAVSRLVFRRGAIRLVTKATHRSVSVPNPSTCKFREVFSGYYVIRGGTGRYRGAGGSGSYVSRIFARLKKARGGGCSEGLAAFWQSTRTWGSLHR
ncbi:MAG TPA: hypothetical protein VMA72_11005 [Streptosporangiaceae bacterium]|nr:hypothetical protein [Streptosporangiaceae bacterium]